MMLYLNDVDVSVV